MKLFIPTIGSELELLQPCEVIIYGESRNQKFLKELGVSWSWEYQPGGAFRHVEKVSVIDQTLFDKYGCKIENTGVVVTIPAGVVLKINRIYIRQGAEDFDSVTFNCAKNKKFPNGRFWLKLEDVNKMDVCKPVAVEIIQETRKNTKEENRLKKNVALYKRILRVEQKALKKGKTIENYENDKALREFDQVRKSSLGFPIYRKIKKHDYEVRAQHNVSQYLAIKEKAAQNKLEGWELSCFTRNLYHFETWVNSL